MEKRWLCMERRKRIGVKLKIPNHEVKDIVEDYEDDSNDIIDYIRCSYEGTDLIEHTVEGECRHCDFERVRKKEDEMGLDWLDKTEAWDYYDYWMGKYGNQKY